MNRYSKLTVTMLFALALALPTFAQTSKPAEGTATDNPTTTEKAAPKKTKKTHKKHAAKKEAATPAPTTAQ
ncbi:MAG TPA: hypothetical protein VD837_02425 [Terriglobales bacterium]|nr:hypothetical protein [Terriglobales bacterium]